MRPEKRAKRKPYGHIDEEDEGSLFEMGTSEGEDELEEENKLSEESGESESAQGLVGDIIGKHRAVCQNLVEVADDSTAKNVNANQLPRCWPRR